jgi:predicted adenylyl cyclase CyaB
MREVELKAVVDDLSIRRKNLETAGAKPTYDGWMLDRRFDVAAGELAKRDEVLRLRRYENQEGVRTYLDWKGATEIRDVYKTREEISTFVGDSNAIEDILARLGLVASMEIDRQIVQYEIGGAVVRFETYPRMDILVEVEGDPESISHAIEALGMPRGAFTSDRLTVFVERFERRTGVKAALNRSEL